LSEQQQLSRIIKYIKKTKPNTKYKLFLAHNQNPKPNTKYNQSKKKDLNPKPKKVLCLFTEKKRKHKNMKTIKKKHFCSLNEFLSHSYYSYYSLECDSTYAAKKEKMFIKLRESVSSVMPAVLSTAVSGLTGSNPVSRIIFSYSY
jgi:hypothetical protein